MMTHWRSEAYFTLKRLFNRSRVRACYRYLNQMQKRPAHEQAAEQARLLAELCVNAERFVPAYQQRFREAGLDCARLQKDPGALSRVRPLYREEIGATPTTFTRMDGQGEQLERVLTGGTGGSPLCVVRDARAKDWWLAQSFLLNAWTGLSVGEPYFFLWGASQDIARSGTGLRRLNIELLHRRRTLHAAHMSSEKELEFLHELNASPSHRYILGYANELHNLAVRSLQSGPRLRRPFKAVIATAEPLTDSMRATIARAFQCTVYNRYGSREAGDIASECRHQRGLHVNPLFTHIEVTDDSGEPLGYGQEGQLLVTNLHNHAMPLIRYAIGDRGVLQPPEPCSCGVSWPTIARLTGRVNDWVYLCDGSRLRCSVLESVLVTLPALKRFQIHQQTERSLRIRLSSLEPDYLTHRQKELEWARKQINQLSGTALDVQFEVTAGELYKTPAGKEPLITHGEGLLSRRGSVDAGLPRDPVEDSADQHRDDASPSEPRPRGANTRRNGCPWGAARREHNPEHEPRSDTDRVTDAHLK